MTVSQIIEEIKQLSPGERAKVDIFLRQYDSSIRLSPAELAAIAKIMAETPDDNEAAELGEKIIAGFYRTK
jgi:DNA-binding MurR/RpiR family transcriptional regulator